MTVRPTTTQLLTEYLTLTKDTTSANQSRGQRLIQYFYTFLSSEANNYATERTKVGTLFASQRSYFLPPDAIKPKTVRVLSGTTWYPLEEVKSVDRWHQMIGFDHTSNIPTHWIVFNEQGNLHIELDPIPSVGVSEGFEIVYEGHQRPLLFPAEYSTGTIALAKGDYQVTGSGTTFTSSMVGQFLMPTSGQFAYDISAFVDTTHIQIANFFQETTLSGQTFVIGELLRLPPEFDFTPVWGAVAQYYKPTNSAKSKEFESWYARDLLMLQDKYKSKSKGAVTVGRQVGGQRWGGVPRNYPTSALTSS